MPDDENGSGSLIAYMARLGRGVQELMETKALQNMVDLDKLQRQIDAVALDKLQRQIDANFAWCSKKMRGLQAAQPLQEPEATPPVHQKRQKKKRGYTYPAANQGRRTRSQARHAESKAKWWEPATQAAYKKYSDRRQQKLSKAVAFNAICKIPGVIDYCKGKHPERSIFYLKWYEHMQRLHPEIVNT